MHVPPESARPRHRRRGGVLALAVAVVLAAPGAVRAGDGPPPEDLAAASVYREILPTSSGGSPGGVSTGAAAPLPRAIADELRSRPDGISKALPDVATSSAYGAPTGPRLRAVGPTNGSHDTSAIPALGDSFAAAGADSKRLVVLLLVLAGTAALLAVATVRSRN